jgi:hypothetical protein
MEQQHIAWLDGHALRAQRALQVGHCDHLAWLHPADAPIARDVGQRAAGHDRRHGLGAQLVGAPFLGDLL